jgi:6-phosphofructokinase 1
MPTDRIPSTFDETDVISELMYLNTVLEDPEKFPQVKSIRTANIRNDCDPKKVGQFKSADDRRSVTKDAGLLQVWIKKGPVIPTFLVAGPRDYLGFRKRPVHVAIVTTGGSAPGLNRVIHSIVKRHHETYRERLGNIYGVKDSFLGMCDFPNHREILSKEVTETWIDRGGSMLGMRRYRGPQTEPELSPEQLATKVLDQLQHNEIDILYVIGGDGSLSIAHEIARQASAPAAIRRRRVSVVGIPKTMDNDVMWVSESFGFKTAVDKAAEIINTLNSEAETSRRICLIELFGAESGYVAAHSALASGHVDLVLIPEEFVSLSKEQCEKAVDRYVRHLKKLAKRAHDDPKEKPHAVVVLAEGTAKILHQKKAVILRETADGKGDEEIVDDFLMDLKERLRKEKLTDKLGNEVDVFFNRPRHYIRASPANAQDKIYCEQLGALAVDSALAGYTDFMISRWLDSYVLVPLELVAGYHKRIPTSSIFWKQVVNSTGQPSIECEDDDENDC